MKRSVKITLIVIILLLIVGMILYSSLKNIFGDGADANPKNPQSARSGGNNAAPLVVNAKIVEYETLSDGFYTIGSILPDEEVDLSFETSGKIVSINFVEGSFVKKGQLLAKVNDAPLQAELKKLNAGLQLAKDRVYRQRTLLEKDAVSKEAYEQVNTDLAKLEADIELTKSLIDQTELRAPFDGVIGLRSVSEGKYASPTTLIAKLTKITPLKIEFSINERQANEVHQGTKVKFQLQGDETDYYATVYAVESEIDIKTRTMKARAVYSNSNRRLKPGRSASIQIQLQEIKNAITTPSEAMISEMGRDIAYIYRSGQAHIVELTKGLRTENKIQILDGLKRGDTLITSGSMQLRDGMPIKVQIMNQ